MKNFGYTIDEEFVHVMGHVHLNCSGYIVSQKKKKMLWVLKMRWFDLFFGNSKQIMVNLIC